MKSPPDADQDEPRLRICAVEGDGYVIVLTSLNGQPMAVNSDLIKLVEGAPDTVITLLSGEKLLVREGMAEVIAGVISFRRAILSTEPIGSSIPNSHLGHEHSFHRDHFHG